jgi:transcriptional regulator of acetoin/glycerol metabolism
MGESAARSNGRGNIPLRLGAYERAALLRALHECDGDPLEAAELLGVSKSAMYRRMAKHAIPGKRRGAAPLEDPPFIAGEPVSLDAYERLALQRALVAADGSIPETARLLGVGRSTVYRKLVQHAIA